MRSVRRTLHGLALVVWRSIPDRWWTYPPYLPVPPLKYIKFRNITYSGKWWKPPGPRAFLTYCGWVADMDRYLRESSSG